MPAGDLIFKRLELATEAELRSMAVALHEEKKFLVQKSKAEQIDALSRWLRADAGSALANPFRSDHELSYFKVLEDVVAKAASAASWKAPTIDASLALEGLEDYALRAFNCAASKSISPRESDRLRRLAERALLGEIVETPGSGFTKSAVLLGVGAGTAAMVGSVPVFIGVATAAIAGPALRRTVPAVLVLIHIRYRVQAEATLGRPS